MTRDRDRSTVPPVAVPARGLLSSWSTHDWAGGVHVDELAALERLLVTTVNSTYEIILVAPASGSVLVRGGAYFPVFTSARLAGSSLGGSFLKLRTVHVGFRLELGNTEQCRAFREGRVPDGLTPLRR